MAFMVYSCLKVLSAVLVALKVEIALSQRS
jgi:hypothetical protein